MSQKDFLPTPENKHEKGNAIFLITYSVVLIVALLNLNDTMSFLGWIYSVLSPFIIGIVIAFILNIIMNALETRVFSFLNKKNCKLWQRIRRAVCLVLSFIIIILAITILLLFIVPQLSQSIQTLYGNMPGYITYIQNLTNTVLGYFNLTTADLGQFAIDWNEVFNKTTAFVANISPGVLTFATGFTSAIFNFFMGLIFAVYLLISKESIFVNIKNTIRAYLPQNKVHTIFSIGKKANTIFTSFVVGQLTEALILGTMYFIGTSIFRMPYVPLISTIMAVCSLIPMFGAVIGAVLSAFLLLLVSPNTALVFIIMAIVFQQVEGNFIYPRVVGSSVGLPGVWVLLAILLGGSFGGAFGMIIAVPIASLMYSLLRDSVKGRLRQKDMEP